MPGATEVAQRTRTASTRSRRNEAQTAGNTTIRSVQVAPKRSVNVRVEIYGLVILVFALIVLLSLVSFHPSDVDKEARVALGGVQNWIGPVGAHIANLFLLIMGVAAFALDLALVGVGICVLIGFRPDFRGRDVLVAGTGLLSTVILLHLCFDGQRVLGYPAGGYLGAYAGEGARMLLSTVGTAIVAVTVLTIAVMLLTGRSVTAFWRVLWAGGLELGGFVRKYVSRTTKRSEAAVRAFDHKAPGRMDVDDGFYVTSFPPAVERSKAHRDRDVGPAPEPLISERRFIENPGLSQDELDKTSLDLKPIAPDSAGEATADCPHVDDANEDTNAVKNQKKLINVQKSDVSVRKTDGNYQQSQEVQKSALTTPTHGQEPKIVESAAMRRSRVGGVIAAEQEKLALGHPTKEWELPPLSFLPYEPPKGETLSKEVLKENAQVLEQKLLDFGVQGKVVEIHPGPVVTMYEFRPAAGVKISKIANLADDLTMALAAMRIRIVAPIPGKSVVGIEVPNKAREMVYLKEVFSDDSFRKAKGVLTLALGKDIVGYPQCADLARMPHLLVAGSTGSGKSVALNSFICSILYKACPQDVRLIMVDPKMLELSVYEGIPHLLLPVVTDPKQAATALKWAVGEMERRYRLLADMGVRNIASYNAKIERLHEEQVAESMGNVGAPVTIVLDDDHDGDGPDDVSPMNAAEIAEIPEKLPYIVVIIDELADLMMVASKDVETSIARLAQMARAAGIHLILATQRPSVDVITGLIKANFPARMSFQVSSKIDSRTILDRQGAENLLGQGDMLYIPPGTSKLTRVHGAYIGDEEIEKITKFLKAQARPQYCMEILAAEGDGTPEEPIEYDEFYDQAVAIVAETRQASISYLQRRLKIGYNRAARIVEIMEKEGIVGPQHGPGPREVLIDPM